MYLPYGEGKGLGSREGWPYNLGKAGTLGPREGSCLSGIRPWFHTRSYNIHLRDNAQNMNIPYLRIANHK
jgi:hypothetical protein